MKTSLGNIISCFLIILFVNRRQHTPASGICLSVRCNFGHSIGFWDN